MTDPVLVSPLVQSIGWALVNSIWQGTLIGAATALALRAISSVRASTRYLVACTGLMLMLLAPLLSVFAGRAQDPLEVIAIAATSGDAAAIAPVERILPLTVAVWVVGVALMSVRLLVAGLGIERLKRITCEVDAELSLRLCAIAHRLGVERPVQIFESSVVRVPAVVGWFRPVILLPASVITGLPAAHLDAVLAHELAHIRRHDYLVNALQSIVETLLFYHPAVWWCSRQIRIEREHCCDDLVVEACCDRVGYAAALAQLEELRGLKPMLSMNVTSGRLIDRVRRVLKQSSAPEGRSTAWLMVPALTLVAIAVVLTPVLTTADAERGAMEPQVDRTLQEGPPAPPRPPRTPAPPEPVSPGQLPTLPALPAPAAPAAPPTPVAASVVPVAPVAPVRAPVAPTATVPPAPQAFPAPPVPPDFPLPPDPPPVPDVSEIAAELNRAAAELMNGFDEMRRAAQEIAREQLQLAQTQAALEKMKSDVLAKNTDIEAIRKAMAELSARHAALTAQSDLTEMRKQIEAIREELQKLRAR